MTKEPRKVSDVIITMEADIKEILGHVRNQDMTIKLLINRIQALENMKAPQSSTSFTQVKGSSPLSVQASELPPAIPAAQMPQMPGLKPGVRIGPQNQMRQPQQQSYAATPKAVDEVDYDDEGNEQIEIETQPKGRRRGVRYGTAEESVSAVVKKMPVQQKILYPDGKNVCLANVEIFSSGPNGLNLIQKCRTNSAGKWNVSLEPGNYLVNISKVGTSTKPSVEASYQINVPISDVPMELKPYKSS